MQRVAVGVGIDGDRLDPHLARGLDDPAGDFAAIGNQDTLEHAAPAALNPPTFRRCSKNVNSAFRTGQSARRPSTPLRPAARHRPAITASSSAKAPRPTTAPIAILLTLLLTTAARMASDGALQGQRVRRQLRHRHRHGIDIGKPERQRAERSRPAAPRVSPTNAADQHDRRQQECAKPTTDQKPNGFLNSTALPSLGIVTATPIGRDDGVAERNQDARRQAPARPVSADRASARRRWQSRRANETAVASATPAASSRGVLRRPRHAAHWRPSRPWMTQGRRRQRPAWCRAREPRTLTAHIAGEGDAGEHDRDQPDFARIDAAEGADRLVGMIGSTMKVMASRIRARARSPAQVMRATQPWIVLARGQNAGRRDRGGGRDPHVADHGIGASAKVSMPAIAVVAE